FHPLIQSFLVTFFLFVTHLGSSFRCLINFRINLRETVIPRWTRSAPAVIVRCEISAGTFINRSTSCEHDTEIATIWASDALPPNRHLVNFYRVVTNSPIRCVKDLPRQSSR